MKEKLTLLKIFLGYCAKEEEVVPFLDDLDCNKELIEDCTFVLSLVLFILGPR